MTAINHILTHNYNYQKPGYARYLLSRITGHGLICVEEDQHKQQRKIMVSARSDDEISHLIQPSIRTLPLALYRSDRSQIL